MTTWILSAHRAGATLYEHEVPGAPLSVLASVNHPEGRLKDQEINSDRFGRAFERGGIGQRAMDTEQRPHEKVAEDFARALAEDLGKARHAGEFKHLILIASPTMLGLLRNALDDATTKCVEGTLAKEYREEDRDQLEKALADSFLKLPDSDGVVDAAN